MTKKLIFWFLSTGAFTTMLFSEDPVSLELLKQPGYFALIRHALAPGTGDPVEFDLQNCSTQRNLSEAGRQQAVAMGDLFRKQGIEEAAVYTSQWCRCRETANLLNLGKVEDLPALNSFFGRPEDREPTLKALRGWLAKRKGNPPTLLITHQVTVTALTDIFPASGEIVVVRMQAEGDIEVAGRIQTR